MRVHPLIHGSVVPAGTALLLFVLLLATVAATAGCGSPQVGARPLQPTPTATSAPTVSPTAPVTTTPAPSAATPTVSPQGGQATPAPVTLTAERGTATASPTAAPPATSTTTDVEAAVQTVLDYFDAVNQQDYSRAYGFWAGGGAASGQTPEQFAQGYANTVRVSVLLGSPSTRGTGAARQVVVPVTIMSVVNQPDQTQKLQHYQGTYTLQPSTAPGATGWEIVTASVAEVSGAPLPPADVADPTTLLRSYFDAINSHEFARAYSYWDNLGQASGQSFAQFEQGFATTKQVKVDLGTPQEGGAAGSIYADVPVTIVATQSDGSTRSYTGTYTTRQANIRPFDQLGWRIEGAKITLEEQPPASTPTPVASQPRSVTPADNGGAIELHTGDRFLLDLDEGFDWSVNIADPAIVARVADVTVLRGAQGIFEAKQPGTTVLTAVGDPPCRKSRPPCAAPSRLFRIQITVV